MRGPLRRLKCNAAAQPPAVTTTSSSSVASSEARAASSARGRALMISVRDDPKGSAKRLGTGGTAAVLGAHPPFAQRTTGDSSPGGPLVAGVPPAST